MKGRQADGTRKALRVCFLASLLLMVSALALETLCIVLEKPSGSIPSEDVLEIRRLLEEERYIIHAGGALVRDGVRYTYTNSREALENALAAGNRVIELDFRLSRDGYYLCGHSGVDSGKYPWVNGIDAAAPLDREEFLNRRIFDFLTPMDLDYVAEIMRERTDVHVVTDVKDDNIAFCETVKKLYPELMDRFIIQIYHETEYAPVRDAGFRFIIFTVYRLSRMERLLITPKAFASHCELTGFTFGAERYQNTALKNRLYLKKIQNSGCPLYVHTVDDREEQRKLFDAGVSAIYTNETDNGAYR